MTDPNPESNANANQDLTNQLTDQTNSNGTSTLVQRPTSIQPGSDARVGEAHHVTSQRGRPSTLSTGNQHDFRLGNTRPWPSEYAVGLNQGGQGAARIAQPSDSLQPLTITWTFSTTIREYVPPRRQSIAVQDTQPHTMPASIILNSTGSSRLVHNENSHSNTGETIQNVRDEIRTPSVYIEPTIPVIIVGNAATGIPQEIARDFEYSIPTNEPQNRNELAVHSADEQLLRESLRHVRSGNDSESTRNIDYRGEASPNTVIIPVVDQNNTAPNQANITGEQAVATTLPTDSSSSQIRETERNVDAPMEGGQQMGLTAVNPVINQGPKQRTPSSSSDESAGATEA